MFSTRYASLKDLFTDYRKSQKCLPAFNVNDMYDLKAVIESADRLDSNIMVMTYPPVAELFSPEIFRSVVDSFKKQTRNRVYLHLDHSTSVDLCKRAIDAGYDSVMIDGSHQLLDENIELTREVVNYASSAKVVVEAEIGKILGRGVVVKSTDDYLAGVSDVRRLYESAGPDIIAVGIGTAHGYTPDIPKIHFNRLAEIANSVPAPLVLHGGTGISDQDIQKAIGMGISKINIGTILHSTYMKHVRIELEKAGSSAYPPYIMKEVLQEMKKVVTDRIAAVNSR